MKPVTKVWQGPQSESTSAVTSLGRFFFDNALKYADNTCQINATTHEIENYSSVNLRSVRVAIALQSKGITSKDVVLHCSFNSMDNVIPMIASFYLGAKVVNLDPTLSVKQSQHLISLVSPRLIFVEDSSIDLIEKSLEGAAFNTEIIVFGKSDKYSTFNDLIQPKTNEDKFQPVDVDIHDTAAMFFSSGSTGLPKAICHSHYSFLNNTEIAKKCSYDSKCIMHMTTFYWISAMSILAQCFVHGGTRVFCYKDMDGENILKTIEKYKLTAMFMAPILTYKLTSVENPQRYNISSLLYLWTGGTPIDREQFYKLNSLFKNGVILFGYGLTEAAMVSTFIYHKDKDLILSKLNSCGKVAAEITVKLVDPDTNETIGTPKTNGEIRVKSPGLMKGYYNLDSTDCFDEDGFLKTGDIGYFDEDECLYIVARIKEMFKYLSWHIVPSAIEAVLREHPAVKEALICGIPKGEVGEVPGAYVVLKDNVNVTEDDIIKYVDMRVSDRERLRGGVQFFQSIPRTPTGKVIRSEAKNIMLKSLSK